MEKKDGKKDETKVSDEVEEDEGKGRQRMKPRKGWETTDPEKLTGTPTPTVRDEIEADH